MKKLLFFIALLFLVAHPALGTSFGSDIASSYPVADPDAVTGDILVAGKDGIVRATTPYDQQIFGVLATDASIVLRSAEPGSKPVSRSGVADVNVVGTNGPIAKGDYITASTTVGKGQKATSSGYVLGQALQEMTGESGTISVAVRIEYADAAGGSLSRLLNYIAADLFGDVESKGWLEVVLRLVIAALVLLVSIAIAFITVSRTAPKGSMVSLALTAALMLGIVGLGLAGSIIILRF